MTGRSTALPDLGVPVHDTAGASFGTDPLVIGGGNSTEQGVVQRLQPGGWAVIGHLPRPRSDLSVVVSGGRILVIGGYDGVRPAETSILSSKDGRTWASIGTLPVPVRYAATAVVGTNVWVFGGERSHVFQRAVQQVDVRTGRTTVVAQVPVPLGHAMAIPIGNRILLLGGRTSPSTLTARMWWFDPATGRFKRAGTLPMPVADSAVAVLSGTAYLLGGETPTLTDRVVVLRY